MHSIPIHLALAFLLSFYTAYIGLILSKYVFNESYNIDFETIWVRGLNSLSFNFFVYIAIIAIVYAHYYLKKQKEVALKQEQLKTQLLDSKISALQSQLQPHFLFNALNDISAMMDINVEKSQNAVADLSELLRSTLQIKNTKFITLQKELDILNHYLDIEKIRFGEKLKINIEVKDSVLNALTPPLLLQPFIENALKHGFSYHHDFLEISLHIFNKKNRLIFKIQNDGTPLEDQDSIAYGTGIANVLERLSNLYNGDYYFEMKNIYNQNKPNVLIFIDIPTTLKN